MSQHRVRLYEFDAFRVDTVKRLLLSEGEPVSLAPKAFDILLTLVENSGQVLAKEVLISKVWPDSFVEEINLTVHISALRKVLGDSPSKHKYIVTIPRRGYTFVASVTKVTDSDFSQEESEPEQARPLAAAEWERGGPLYVHRSTRAHITLVLSLLLGFVLAASSYFLIPKKSSNITDETKPRSIAVLPFNMLNANSEEYLELGLADALITKLSKLKQISVRPTSAISNYTGQDYDPLVAGRKLGVDAIIQGTIQRDQERTRVTVQMISIASGSPVWAERFDESNTNIFNVQDSISEQVTQALMLKIGGQNLNHPVKPDTENAEAYRAYLRGIYFWNKRSDGGLKKASEYFQQAIENDANYARAYAMLADTYYLLGSLSPDKSDKIELFEKAKSAALKAIEVDETIAEAHTALAMVRSNHDGDPRAAETEHKRAIELNPNYATAHQRYGWYLRQEGQVERASQEMQLAVELDPLSAVNASAWANLLYSAKQFDKAIEQCSRALEINPDFDPAQLIRVLCYEQKQMYDKALEEAYKAAEKDQMSILDLETIGHIYAAAGRKAEALKFARELKARARNDPTAFYGIALIHEGLGASDEAFFWLKKAASAAALPYIPLRLDPRCERLVADSRFIEFRETLSAALRAK